jgi:hypothetical protein
MGKINVIQGERYGHLTVIKEADKIRTPSGQTNRVFKCKCDCGNIKEVRLLHLRHGRIKSCGCIKNTLNGKWDTPIGKSYRAMRYRCSPSYFQSQYYYKRGITVCDAWLNDFSLFEKWAKENGFKKGLQLDRIDNDKGYSPYNCRYVDSIINCNNTRKTIYINYGGKRVSLKLIIREKGLIQHYTTIWRRIKRGWDPQKAIDTPINKKHKKD